MYCCCCRGKKESKDRLIQKFDAQEHREHIFGIHVQNYFDMLKKENPQRFEKQFK